MRNVLSSMMLRCAIAVLCAIQLVGAAPLCAAQTAAPVPDLDGIAHVAIRVSDLEKSRDFYAALGFEQAFARSKNGIPTEAFLKVNDRQFIELYPRENASQQVGFMHVCFESKDLNALQRAYTARGLSPTDVRRAGAGNLLFTMRGPENQNLEYTQYMPGSMHSNDRGKHLGANRVSSSFVGVSIGMRNTTAARAFYLDKLAFQTTHAPLTRHAEAGTWLVLPGDSTSQIEISNLTESDPGEFQIYFVVASLKKAEYQLSSAHLKFQKNRHSISVSDPDGNHVVLLPSAHP